jgi:polyhydroxyalkanoate synthesis regulator phasin
MKKYSVEDMFKTVVYTGVGIAATATEKFQKTIDEMVEKGKIPAEDGRKYVEDFFKDTEGRREEFEDRFKSTVKSVVDKFDFPTKKDYQALVKRVEKLEKAARAAKSAEATKPTVKKATPVKPVAKAEAGV